MSEKLVLIGGGPAGLSAAVSAYDNGIRDILIIERDEVLGGILQSRMDNKKITFFTSNYTLEELEVHLSDTATGSDKIKARRIIERIKELTVPIKLVGENKRGK